MKIKYYKFKNWLLVLLASMLGLNVACGQPKEAPKGALKEEPVSEYGGPIDEYQDKAIVEAQPQHSNSE